MNNTSADIEGLFFFIISGQNFEIPAIVLLTTKIFVYATVNESSREVLPFRPGRDSCEVTDKVTSLKIFLSNCWTLKNSGFLKKWQNIPVN